MSWLLDPRLFNYFICALFVCAMLRWAVAGHWGQTLYWFASVLITIAVTWGMK